MSLKKLLVSGASVLVLGLPFVSSAAVLYSQSVTLHPGWNVVSTPKVLASHNFSATENSTNFDIYTLDSSKTSGWATLADSGGEFQPLYGYFVDNKTGANQTLMFNYSADTAPNQRLFQRTFSATGWYSFGVANPSYALPIGTATTTDTNNPSSLLSALVVGSTSGYDTVVDFTNASSSSDINSVGLADPWKAVIDTAVNTLNDLRETKGYAIYIKQANTLYGGHQDNTVPQCMDGIDNDGDGFVDYPSDPGCSSPTDNSESTIAGISGDITNSTASADAAQNISVNVSNQPLGGFVTNFSGESVSVSGMTLLIASSTNVGGPLTSISITDNNGAVVAGPVDENGSGNAVFSDTVTFPVGAHTYHVRGKIATGASNDKTITVTVTPSNWTNPTGQTSGNSISLSNNNSFSLNQMTVRVATTSITVSSSPAAQNVVAGTQGLTFTNVQLDASQSGEDVRFSSLPILFTGSGGTYNTDLSSCQLFDGATALTTGSRVVNSTGTSGSTLSFSFDNSLTVPKGTVKTISVVCNISSSATSGTTYQFGIKASGYSATGVTSGTSVTPSIAAAMNGGAMTVTSGSATVAVDSSSPSFSLKAAGSTGITASVLKFHVINEALNLTKVGLTLVNGVGGAKSNGSGNSTHSTTDDIVQAYIYNGSTLVGTASFTGTNTMATSTLTTPVALAKDADTLLTVKLDLATIGISASGGIGDIIKVDPLNFEATGASSGSTISGPTATNTVTLGSSGVQMFKSYPTFANAGVSCNQSNSCVGMAVSLKKFSITANAAGSIGLYQFSTSIATSSASVTNLKLFVYTDSSYSSPANVPGTTAGQFDSTKTPTDNAYTAVFTQTTPLQISAGTTYYFAVVGDVTIGGSATSWTVNTTILGDSATTTSPAGYNVNNAISVSPANFVWSDNATTTATQSSIDWTNGYFVPGLPSSGF